MSRNGDPVEDNRGLIDSLKFPTSMSETRREEYRQYLRANPGDLDFVLDVGELYEFVMAAPNVLQETKESAVAILKSYLGDAGTAFALLVGMYMDELKRALPDEAGGKVIYDRMEKLRVYGIASERPIK